MNSTAPSPSRLSAEVYPAPPVYPLRSLPAVPVEMTVTTPHLVHVVSLGLPLTARERDHLNQFRALNPDWLVSQWNESNLPPLPNDGLRSEVATVSEMHDLARYALLAHFGGIALDLQAKPVRPLGDALDTPQAFLTTSCQSWNGRDAGMIQPGLMGGPAGDPFWRFVNEQLAASATAPASPWRTATTARDTWLLRTGPCFLAKTLEAYAGCEWPDPLDLTGPWDGPGVTLFPSRFFPIAPESDPDQGLAVSDAALFVQIIDRAIVEEGE